MEVEVIEENGSLLEMMKTLRMIGRAMVQAYERLYKAVFICTQAIEESSRTYSPVSSNTRLC